jgi:predicted O-methyltransferase YrrM
MSLDWVKLENESTNELEKLACQFKVGKLFYDYLKRYDQFLRDKRHSATRVLEVGVDKGLSLKMWAQYFKNAEIIGVDREQNCLDYQDERTKVIICNSSSPQILDRLKEIKATEFDVVIDDGSHWYWDQVDTFKHLFPLLKPGGLYVVEDVGFPDHPLRHKAFDAFKELVAGINYYPEGFPLTLSANPKVFQFPDVENYWIKNVVGVSFYRSLIFIEKGRNPEDNKFWSHYAEAEKSRLKSESELVKARKAITFKKLSQVKVYAKIFLNIFGDYNRRFFIKNSEHGNNGLVSTFKGILRMFRQIRIEKD